MRLAVGAFVALFLLPGLPAAQTQPDASETPSSVETTDGQTAAPEEVLAAFTRLVDRGEARALFGLPQDTFWRRSGKLDIALLADDWQALKPILERVTEPFADASGLPINVISGGPAEIDGKDKASLVPEAELVVVVASRGEIADFTRDGGFNLGMLANFEMGRWPFMFSFAENDRHRGIMLLADDEPERAREASFILATVWGLGGVTLGPELTGLVGDSDTGPALTPLGQAVFRVFYHEDLEIGMPLGDAVQRAETLLPQ